MTDVSEATGEGPNDSSLAEALGEAYDKLVAETEEDEATEAEDTVEAEEELEASDDAEDDDLEAAEEAGEDEEEDEAESEEEDEAEAEGLEPLSHWPKHLREQFSGMPKEAQTYAMEVHKGLEQAHSQRTQELAEREKGVDRLNEIKQLFEPYRSDLQRVGLDEVAYIKQMVGTVQQINANPAEGIRGLAQQYGVDLAELAGVYNPDADDPSAARIKQLEDQLRQVSTQVQTVQQVREQDTQAELQKQVDDFQSAADEQGNAKHPHFEAVKQHMSALLAAGTAETLEDAYEQAVWANPQVREKVLTSQREAETKQAEARRKEGVKKAKKASRNVKSRSAPTKAVDNKPETVKGQLEQTWNELVGDET